MFNLSEKYDFEFEYEEVCNLIRKEYNQKILNTFLIIPVILGLLLGSYSMILGIIVSAFLLW